jgi:hypothetical protein
LVLCVHMDQQMRQSPPHISVWSPEHAMLQSESGADWVPWRSELPQ